MSDSKRESSMMRESQCSDPSTAVINKKIRGPNVVFFDEIKHPEDSLKQILGNVNISEQDLK